LDTKPKFEPREFARDERAPRKFERDRGERTFAQRGESSAAAKPSRDKSNAFDENRRKSSASEHRDDRHAATPPPTREHKPRSDRVDAAPRAKPSRDDAPRKAEYGMETFRIEVGHAHGVKPNNIVGAIANEAGLDSKHIGRIDIRDEHSLIDLPEGMPAELLAHLKKVWVAGQRLRISRDTGGGDGTHVPKRAPHAKGKPAKPKKRF
ncbi:MAG: DbpA RNA binding domain-containing protein, partial [Bacteroidetes bacterium]|nr:DbpA RNA binding domain-containing protein [Bacteroidota bacterium]